jgi:hypothetical protein
VRCDGTVVTWDGVALDTTVTMPAGGATSLPLVVEEHGFGNSKYEYLDPASKAYTDNAYGWGAGRGTGHPVDFPGRGDCAERPHSRNRHHSPRGGVRPGRRLQAATASSAQRGGTRMLAS